MKFQKYVQDLLHYQFYQGDFYQSDIEEEYDFFVAG